MADSANIRLQCPHCSKGLRVGAKLAGRQVKCPNTACGKPIDVPLPLDDEPVAQPASRTGGSSPSPRRRSPASGTESSDDQRSASQVRRPRWPWYAGGIAAVCVVTGVVLAIAMSGKDRTKAGGAPGDGNGISGDVNKKDQDLLQSGGLTQAKLLGEWEGTLKDGTTFALMFTDKHVVVSVLDPGINRAKAREAAAWVGAGDARFLRPGTTTAESYEANNWVRQNIIPALGDGAYTIGTTVYQVDAQKNEVKFKQFQQDPNPTAVAKPTTDGALLVSGEFKALDYFSCTVPETRLKRVRPGAPVNTSPEPLQTGGLTKEKLLGEWAGTLKDGTTVAFLFTEQLVGLSIAAPGTNREKAREALKFASESAGGGGSSGGFSFGSNIYEIDAAKNEVKICKTFNPNGWSAVAKPTKDGALLVSGKISTTLSTWTVPETRIERVKPGAPAKTPKVQIPGAKGEPVVYVGKPTNPWAIYLSDADGLPKGGPKAPWSQVLPSGTKKLQVGVVFSGEPSRVDVSVRVRSGSGPIDLADLKQEWILLNSTYVRQAYIAPKSGAFPDGPYQAEVIYNDTKVAVLNWSVGGQENSDKKTPSGKGAEADTKDLPRDGPGDPGLTYDAVNKNTAKTRGKRVTWAFVPCSTDGKRMMCALDKKEAMGTRHAGIYVVEFASQEEAGRAFRSASFKTGITITGTIAGEVEQFLVVRGEPQKDIPKVTVPLLVHPKYVVGDDADGTGKKGE